MTTTLSPIIQRLGAAVVDAHGHLYEHDGNPGQLQVGQHGPAGSTNWHPAGRNAPELPKIYRTLQPGRLIPISCTCTGFIVQHQTPISIRTFSYPNLFYRWYRRQYIYLWQSVTDSYVDFGKFHVFSAEDVAQLRLLYPETFPDLSQTEWFRSTGNPEGASAMSREWAYYDTDQYQQVPLGYPLGFWYRISMGDESAQTGDLWTLTIANAEHVDLGATPPEHWQEVTFTGVTPNATMPTVYTVKIWIDTPVVVTVYDDDETNIGLNSATVDTGETRTRTRRGLEGWYGWHLHIAL